MNTKIEPTESQQAVISGLVSEGCTILEMLQNPESRVIYITAHEADDEESVFMAHVSSLGDVDWTVG